MRSVNLQTKQERSMARKKKQPQTDLFPWFDLLDLELSKENPIAEPKQKGRPRLPYDQKKITLYMSADQLKMLDDIKDALMKSMKTRKLSRGTLVAFMTVRLMIELQNNTEGEMELPENINSFAALSRYLDKK
jgi:hypothetical protein